jgi:hypothetical protein
MRGGAGKHTGQAARRGRDAAAGFPRAVRRGPSACWHTNKHLRAPQVAANTRGIALVHELIAEHGLRTVSAYMGHIQANAEGAVRDMLREFSSRQAGFGARGRRGFRRLEGSVGASAVRRCRCGPRCLCLPLWLPPPLLLPPFDRPLPRFPAPGALPPPPAGLIPTAAKQTSLET